MHAGVLGSRHARVTRRGGEVLFYAWAREQEGGVSRHEFTAANVLVPWHHKEENRWTGSRDGNKNRKV